MVIRIRGTRINIQSGKRIIKQRHHYEDMWQEHSLSSSDMMLCSQPQLAKTDSLLGGAATVTDALTTACNYTLVEYKQYHHHHGNWSVTYCIFLPKSLNMERMAKHASFLKHLHLFNLYLSR